MSLRKSLEDADEKYVGQTTGDWTQTQTTTSTEPLYFVKDLAYTEEEERAVVRILDTRLYPVVLLTTFVLNMDRTNISNAISDNLASDLGFTLTTVNTATAIYSVFFSLFCFTGAVMAKITGPARWIPILMFAWGWVTLSHALITVREFPLLPIGISIRSKDRAGYLTVRVFIAITEGGVIPATLIYLGGFYKGTELTTRLAGFWGVQSIASAVSGLMASGLLQLAGRGGLEGWKWLFVVDGIITVVGSVFFFLYLPRSITKTEGGIRGLKPWFTERQLQIAVTRLIRDDQSKEEYEKRATLQDFIDAAKDVGLWGHLIITTAVLTPTNPLGTYLPSIIKTFKFNVFVSNALTAPPYILQCFISVTLIRHSGQVGERGFHGAFSSAWQMVGWILLRVIPDHTPRGAKYFCALFLAAWPYSHPLNIGWMSENTGNIGRRTVASGAIIFAANIYGVWASQIYQADDAPFYKKGNSANIAVAGFTLIMWIVQKYYYIHLNRKRERAYAALSEEEKILEQSLVREKGNQSLLFRFTT
ncbi:MFS general substrate transporter [Mycena chlorophos]|uniref:MFS general substrate transporter n=1 Tax=Mycena chlorophos TaxID=658473 RepID=A0A8H6TA03_MYCCL|nr:MFS general substrate transporter [Mycena chlorophos]